MSTRVKRIIIASVIAAVVIVIASIAVKACRENRLLEEGSVDVKAVIEKVERRHHEERYQRIRHRVHRHPAYTSYTIYFAYTVDGVEYHDDFTTRKGMLRSLYKGDSIIITYAIKDPAGVHRLTALPLTFIVEPALRPRSDTAPGVIHS